MRNTQPIPMPERSQSEPDSNEYAKVVKTCPVCMTNVTSYVSRSVGGRPREFHKECKPVWGMLKRLEYFIEGAKFDGTPQSMQAASMLRSRFFTLSNRLNRYGRPTSLG